METDEKETAVRKRDINLLSKQTLRKAFRKSTNVIIIIIFRQNHPFQFFFSLFFFCGWSQCLFSLLVCSSCVHYFVYLHHSYYLPSPSPVSLTLSLFLSLQIFQPTSFLPNLCPFKLAIPSPSLQSPLPPCKPSSLPANLPPSLLSLSPSL